MIRLFVTFLVKASLKHYLYGFKQYHHTSFSINHKFKS